MKNVILFASQGNNVGKTTTAKAYSKYLKLSSEVYSFAGPIRDCCNSIFKDDYNLNELFTDYYNNRSLKNDLIVNHIPSAKGTPLEDLTFRALINKTTKDKEESEGVYVWAIKGLEFITSSNSSVIMFDDFRRWTESDFLKNEKFSKDFNIITVNLIKKDVKDQVHTLQEGLLSNYDFDIEFNINSDYTNIPDLFCLLDLKLKGTV